MFGINKNGTKHKVGIILPAFFPSSRVTYDNTQSGLSSTDVQDAIDELVQSGGGSIDIQRPTFTEASTRANIESGETISTLFGKIKKWFTDLPSMFVSKSGDTMTGPLSILRGDSNVPLSVQGSAASYTWIRFNDKNGNELGNIGVNSNHKPAFFVYGGFLGEILLSGQARTVTTLVNEAVNIAASGNKTYAALTATALQAYDEIHFLANFGNVFVNGTATKEQMQNITAYTSPANGRLWFFAAGLSVSTEYSFRIRADSNGLQIINGSASLTLNNLRIDGVKYN